MKRADVLTQAATIVNGVRETTYGGPEDNFRTIANLWSIYLSSRGLLVEPLEAFDVSLLMILMKTARLSAARGQHDDSYIDIAGYAACGAEVSDDPMA